MSKLAWQRVEDLATWDALVTRSPQGSLFSESAYLAAAGTRSHLWFVMQGSEVKAGVALAVAADERSVVLDDLVIYGGILFDLDPARQHVKRRHDEFQIAEFVAERLAQEYGQVSLALCPQFQDMRPFLWHCYHGAEEDKYSLDLRYTSYLDISSLREFADNDESAPCFASMETVRRYSVREGRKKGGSVVVAPSGECLLDYYRQLMASQGEEQEEHKVDAMGRVMADLLARERGRVFHALDAQGNVLYCVAYGWDDKRAYYLFGAGHPTLSAPWQGTLTHWEAFRTLARDHGVVEVDLEGVNSPRRGWFKLGFGGDLRPYYQVHRGGKT